MTKPLFLRKKMTPGIRTTEFWLTLLANVLCGYAVVMHPSPLATALGIVGSALSATMYGHHRTTIKLKHPGKKQ